MDKIAMVHATVLDGTKDMVPKQNQTILIDKGLITAIHADGACTDGYHVIDLQGQYVMPGLINLHVHIPSSGKPKKKQTDASKLVKIVTSTRFTTEIAYQLFRSLVKMEAMSGVTTMRTMGGVLDFDSRYRAETASGKLAGPRIIASNMAISVPGGHMAGSLAYEATSPEEAKNYVRSIKDSGADLLKLMVTGGVLDAKKRGEPGELKMQPEIVQAACEEAHRLGLKVAAHAESPEGVRVSLENGVDTIEHGAMPDAEILSLFHERNASHVATLSPALPFALFDRKITNFTEEQQFNGKIVFDGIVGCAKACLASGIPVGLGTDTGCPYTTHYDMWRELYYFHKFCGVSNTFALHTGTLGNAKILGLEKEIGSIEVGKWADLIVCGKNPLENLSVLRNLSMVFLKGKQMDTSGLKKYPAVERQLDLYL